MKTIYLAISLLSAVLISGAAHAQQKHNLQQNHIRFIRKTLAVDSVKARAVALIQDNYKAGMKQVVADTSLSEESRRLRISELMAEKNRKLGQILSPAQLAKIVPTTEREKAPPVQSR